MKSNLGIHLSAAINAADSSQLELSKNIGIKQSTINLIINTGRRPHPDSLAALTGYDWPHDVYCGVSLLIEHLRDEIVRARLRKSFPGMHIVITPVTTEAGDVDETVDSIRAHAHSNPDVARLLSDLLTLLDEQDGNQLMAAEDRPEYGKKKKKQS